MPLSEMQFTRTPSTNSGASHTGSFSSREYSMPFARLSGPMEPPSTTPKAVMSTAGKSCPSAVAPMMPDALVSRGR